MNLEEREGKQYLILRASLGHFILQALCSLDEVVIICCILFNIVWQGWLDEIAGHYLRWEIG